jgi:Family of unknown function (DUF6065)
MLCGMKNKISFTPVKSFAQDLIVPPTPGSLNIPSWYSSANPLRDGDQVRGLHGDTGTLAPNTTYKHCSPFLDAFITGYIWSAPVDFEIKKDVFNGGYIVRWKISEELVTKHEPDQHPNLPAPEGLDSLVLKWEFPYKIETPKGYSTLFTHPLNRNDLPFRTLSGVVDTDTYPIAVNFPFQILEFDQERIIVEKGTPLCQIIPIKRDDWEMQVEKFDEIETKKSYFDFNYKIIKAYKSRYWNRKSYK